MDLLCNFIFVWQRRIWIIGKLGSFLETTISIRWLQRIHYNCINKVHSEEKSSKCNQCEYGYHKEVTLRRHMMRKVILCPLVPLVNGQKHNPNTRSTRPLSQNQKIVGPPVSYHMQFQLWPPLVLYRPYWKWCYFVHYLKRYNLGSIKCNQTMCTYGGILCIVKRNQGR